MGTVHEHPLLKGNLVIAHPNGYIKTRINFWQNGPKDLQIWDVHSLHK